MSIAAGRLRERVTVEQKNLVDNGKGGRMRPADEPEWWPVKDIPDLPAEIIPLRGNEAMQEAILRTVQYYRVTIRARADVLPSHRLMWKGTPLNIKAMARSVDRREIVMTCESGNPG